MKGACEMHFRFFTRKIVLRLSGKQRFQRKTCGSLKCTLKWFNFSLLREEIASIRGSMKEDVNKRAYGDRWKDVRITHISLARVINRELMRFNYKENKESSWTEHLCKALVSVGRRNFVIKRLEKKTFNKPC